MRDRLFIAALASLLVLPAHAGRIEDGFRGFIERMRSAGETVQEYRLPGRFEEVPVHELVTRVDRLPLGRGQYAVFVVPGCRACAAATGYLQSQGLQVEILDLSRSATAREAYALVQGKGFPVVLVGSQRMTGWSERLFQQAMAADVQHWANEMRGQGS